MKSRIVQFSEIAADPTHRLDAEHYIEGTKTMTDPQAYKDMSASEKDIVDLLWGYLPKVKGHVDRRETGYGSKTRWGLVLTIRNVGVAADKDRSRESAG